MVKNNENFVEADKSSGDNDDSSHFRIMRPSTIDSGRAAQFYSEEVCEHFHAKNLSQEFDDYDSRKCEDRKSVRKSRPTISRKDSDKRFNKGSPSPEMTNGFDVLVGRAQFRDRSQTAPSTVLKRRVKDERKVTSDQNDNNNLEETFDGVAGVMEMPKHQGEAKKLQKHRFPFKKNREKENRTREDNAMLKCRTRRTRADMQLTPCKNEPVCHNSEVVSVRARSASAVSVSTERRRRTRRRRGNRKSVSNTGLDNDGSMMDQMSLEEALTALQDGREGQTWHYDENLQCQVINGTTYFTPVNKRKESKQCIPSMQRQHSDQDGDYGSEWTAQSTGSNGYLNESNGIFAMNVEEFRPRTNFSLSEPIARRFVKTDSPKCEPQFCSEKLKAQLKKIWVQSETKINLVRRPGFCNNVDTDVESMTALTAKETVKMALYENESKINENKISKLWESSENNGRDIWEPEKTMSARVSPVDNIWSPRNDLMTKISSMNINGGFSRVSSQTTGAPLGFEAASSGSGSGDIWS